MRAQPKLPIFGTELIEMYLIGSNVSNFENRKQLLNHSTLSYTVLPVQGHSS